MCLRRQWHPTPVRLPGKSHGWRSLVGCSPWGREESDMTRRLHFHFSLSCIGEGNGNPLQCSCLENPRDGEPGGLPSMGSHRVGHDWSDLAAAWYSQAMWAERTNIIRKCASLFLLPGGSDGKESACSAWHSGLIPALVRSPGEGNGNPLQYHCLENSMDRGAWQAIVHGVTKNWTWLSN